ncbi:MAG: hypothetical protein COA61_005070 [Zetaproteobacteria bacterium]|nr:hypothetical protein [Zetaproteobacteria bacterium]
MKLLFVVLALFLSFSSHADEKQDYLYYRDVNVAPYQNLREFFDMPDRSGHYQVTLVSDSIGPLTFDVRRVEGEKETHLQKTRSYAIGDHEFHAVFKNMMGNDDLIVEIANSNPVFGAKVSVIVVELPDGS